jgi:riboflavin synthase
MVLGGRLDGHLVQGHVDQTAVCKDIRELDGSWEFVFEFRSEKKHPLIEKGSICVNGVSLTCYDLTECTFQVSIIPYSFENTNFKQLRPGQLVNLEFDMIGKYLRAISDL